MTTLSKFDKAAVKKQIAYYKEHRHLLQFGEFSRIGDFFTDNIAKWQITSPDKSESMMGYFINRTIPNWGNDVIRFTDLDEEKIYDLSERVQLFSIKNIGEIINTPLPKKIDLEESKLYEFLTETVKLRSEKETYTLDGGALMDAGFKPHQPFVLSGYKLGTTRILLDTDSRMYYLKEKSE